MQSKLLAHIENVDRFDADISRILSFVGANTEYSEFHAGDWKSFVLWNASGRDDDGLVAESDVSAQPTPRGRQLSAINRWIDEYFDTRHLRLVRVHSMGDGALVPHRDFLEFDERGNRWYRVHFTLRTNDTCLHSEEDDVFHMRTGELWHLDASRLHSATNRLEERRLNLCLDFDLGRNPPETVFRRGLPAADGLVPDVIERPPLGRGFVDGLMKLSDVINESNYRDIVRLLSGVHFYRKVGLARFFDWLTDISRNSGSETLLQRSTGYCEFLRDRRIPGQRFVL